MANKVKHLELIQGVINRLSNNSFLLKGWSVILVSAFFAISVSESRWAFVCLAYIPALAFWGLDGYFLWQERLYRALYDQVRALEEAEVDFGMNTRSLGRREGLSWAEAVSSRTLVAFHGILFLAIVSVMALALFT